MRSRELKAVCPVCEGALYIETSDDATDEKAVRCVYCHSKIKTVDVIEMVNGYGKKVSKRR